MDVHFSKVLIVIILYKQKLDDTPAFKSVSEFHRQEEFSVFVYDNSPTPQPVDHKFVVYRHDAANGGVSRGYNHAAQFALREQFTHLLLLDQDSCFPVSTFDAYKTTREKGRTDKIFAPVMRDSRGIVSPFKFRFGKGFRLSSVAPGNYSLKELRVINSGMMIPLEVFWKAGGYDERFPLDLSDIVFTDKLIQLNIHVEIISGTATHSLSAEDQRSDNKAVRIRTRQYESALALYRKISSTYIPLNLLILGRKISMRLKHRKLGAGNVS